MSDQRLPYGTWPSPITSELIVSEAIGLGSPMFSGDDIYWLEMRPREGGRNVVVRRAADGTTSDVTPADFNVRTRAHEYGGGAYGVAAGHVYFTNLDDQRVYAQGKATGSEPRPLTPKGPWRYADFCVDTARDRLIAVREQQAESCEPVDTLVALDAGGDARNEDGGQVLASGADFYSSPRIAPDADRITWLSWNHPNMPWDGTELWVAEFTADGGLDNARRIAGGPAESIFQPEWTPDGSLVFVSDRNQWWNLYQWDGDRIRAVCPMEAEFGLPQWVFGMSTYAILASGEIVCAFSREGTWNLGRVDAGSGALVELDTPYTDITGLAAGAGGIVMTAGSAARPAAVVQWDPATGTFTELRRSLGIELDAEDISQPRAVAFPTEGGETAYGLYYAPRNRACRGPDDERPPLLVKSHGGPTAAASTSLNLDLQYWTSRGFAVVDVNYGGSTGYGRAYRERLYGQWGVVDVDDCVNAARYLIAQGEVDADRIAIRGSSAGGYTTLAALTFRDVFRAGASKYGVSDLEALARETHKFESRYLDQLVGPYPERKDLYRERSPIHHTEGLSAPAIFFQGLEDRVVPPDQAKRMVEALRGKGIPVAYLAFEGEQHGFRQSATIRRVLDAELYFYSVIFGFTPHDRLEPVPIDNT